MDTLLPDLVAAADAARMSDDELLAAEVSLASARRAVEASTAIVSAEIARRSSHELGYAGLAQSMGARTPEALVQQLTGVSAADARKLVSVGTMLTTPTPWLTPVARAVTAGTLSLDGAAAIRTGLGSPGQISENELGDAATQLAELGASMPPERLAALARDARAALDPVGVAESEQERRSRRYLRFTALPGGNYKIDGILDPESMVILRGPIDAITAPRRGGPRFVDPADAPVARGDDDRTIPQLMVDALVDIVQLAVRADRLNGHTLFGRKNPSVRVHVAQRDLSTGDGFAHLEGEPTPISTATARRYACDTGLIPVLFDTDGSVLNVGREQRLHTTRQRIAIAARDGGCVVTGCGRPPQWCEVHHIDEWDRDHGETSVHRGILLCRHHHMLLHNKGWRIVDAGSGEYSMHGPTGAVIQLRRKNPIASRLDPGGGG